MHYLEVDHFLNSSRSWLDQSPYCQLGAVKIFYDGTLTSKTSLMAHPFPATNQYGERIFSPPVFQQLIEKMRRYELPIAVHTIGDQALDELADYLLQFPVKKGLHDRIIHGSFAKYTTIEKLKKLPIIIDIQPQFVTTDFPHALGFVPHNTELIYPWKTYLDAGLIICGSSDAPVEVPDPLLGISSAWRRKCDDGIIYQPEQQLSMFDAIRLYTTLSNVPTYHTSTRGYLKPGYIADFTMLNHDILKHPELIDEAKVVMTVIDDKVVFKKE
jgi:predicted amidohydrolase YtcJ